MTNPERIALISTIAASVYPGITSNTHDDEGRAALAVDIAATIVRQAEKRVGDDHPPGKWGSSKSSGPY